MFNSLRAFLTSIDSFDYNRSVLHFILTSQHSEYTAQCTICHPAKGYIHRIPTRSAKTMPAVKPPIASFMISCFTYAERSAGCPLPYSKAEPDGNGITQHTGSHDSTEIRVLQSSLCHSFLYALKGAYSPPTMAPDTSSLPAMMPHVMGHPCFS